MLSKKKRLWVGALGGGEVVYSPTDFANLKFWYDVSQLTGLNDTDEILEIPDLSGNGIDLTAGVGVRGIYTAGFYNGLPAMAMDGTKIYTPDGSKAAWNWLHQGDSTVFWLVQSSVDNANLILFDSGPSSSASNVGRTMDFRVTAVGSNPGSFRDIARASGGSQIFGNILPNENDAPKDQVLLIVCRFEQAGDWHSMYVNNVLKQAITSGNATTITTSTREPRFFGRTFDTTLRFNGYFLEAFGYDRALSLEEINQIVGGYSYGL